MLGYHGFGANASSDAKPSLKLRLDETVCQASDGQGRNKRRTSNSDKSRAGVQHPMPEFRSELWLGSRGMPEAENLDALPGFVDAIRKFE